MVRRRVRSILQSSNESSDNTGRLRYASVGRDRMNDTDVPFNPYFVLKRIRNALNPFAFLNPWGTPGGT